MTEISIPLTTGRNFISFPAASANNFGTIFTTSGIKGDIVSFQTYDAILGYFVTISDFEYIEQGRGYILDMASPGTITYDGIEYILTFDQFKLRLIQGWNLVGAGASPISLPNWCKILDPTIGIPIDRIESKRSYWVNYYNCLVPTTEPLLLIAILSLAVATTSLYLSLKEVKM